MNSRLLYDIIHYCNENNEPGLVLLIGKTFDSVSWKFIFKVLEFFNFAEFFINCIKVLHDVKLCVIQNVIFLEFFNLGRGCRQGDRLNILIFLPHLC